MMNSAGQLDEQARHDLKIRMRIIALEQEAAEQRKQLASSGNRR